MIRILTEDKNREDVIRLLKWRGIDATILQGRGLFEGGEERSLILELVSIPHPDAVSLSFEIKRMNNQKAVLLQTIQTEEVFI